MKRRSRHLESRTTTAWSLLAACGLSGGAVGAQPAAPSAPATTPATTPASPPAAPAPAAPAASAAPPRATSVAGKPVIASLQPYEDRIVREVRVTGLKDVPEQLVRNQLRTVPGRPMKVETVQADVSRLVRLARFAEVSASVQAFDDQSVALIYTLVETAVIQDVEVAGNRQISDQEIAAQVDILAGTPVDRFQIDRARRKIEELYRQKGYYQADVIIDEQELAESQRLLFRIREGERLRVTDIRFDGNTVFSDGQLRRNVETAVWNIFSAGTLDDTVLDQDIANLVNFYRDRGYLDARVDRLIRPSPDGKEAIITFIVEEGRLYTLRSIRAEIDGGGGLSTGKPTTVYHEKQLAGLMLIKAGDVYSQDLIRKSIQAVVDAYGKEGYNDARINKAELRDPERPEVDLLLLVTEGAPFKTGVISIAGNDLTRDRVIRRQIRVYPDRPLDSVSITESEQRLRELGLFAGTRDAREAPPRITVQSESESDPGYRDVLVEVKETNTGSLGFGAAVSSDSGVVGSITLRQDNFDVTDLPDSFDELFQGRALRGAGQSFNLSIQPGTETQNYSISLAEPYLFETDFTGSAGAAFYSRDFGDYEEQRIGGQFGLGRRFGRVWSGQITGRVQAIDISGISDTAIFDLQDVEGQSTLTGLGLTFTRNTLDSRFRPSKGTRLELSVERVGAAGGDFQFTKLGVAGNAFLTLYEDFTGRKTILNLRSSANWIPEGEDEAPIFERYFLGGRSLRGFDYRGVSPRGFKPGANPGDPPRLSGDPAGGTWSFFAGAEVEQPLIQDIISGVVFVDSGTVTNDPGFSEYRVSVGVGIRLYIQQLSPVPLAFDFGFPIAKQRGDDTQLFSFSLDLPF